MIGHKYITGVMIGLVAGFLSQPLLAYGEAYQEKAEPPKVEEEFVYPTSKFVPQTLKSAVIATPRYPMSDSVSKVVTVVNRYLYDVSKYAPSVVVSRLPDGLTDTSTPEKTMFSRTTAMINGDYDLYSTYWDKKSLLYTEQQFRRSQVTPDRMVGNWIGTLSETNMLMLRRIDIGDYVILIYDLEKKAITKEKMGMELPVTFQLEGGDWRASQALHDDELLIHAPWVSGKNKIEKTVR